MTPEERRAHNRRAVNASWANTADPAARTAPARAAAEARFVKRARELHPDASEEHIARIAKDMKREHYARAQARSVEARKAKKLAAA